MVIRAYFDVRENGESFDMCFYVHNVVRSSKVVYIDDNLTSCKLNTIFQKIAREFRLIGVISKTDYVQLIIEDAYILGGRDCKSTIFNPANQNVDIFLMIGKYRCKLMLNTQDIFLPFPKCTATDYQVTPSYCEIDKYFNINDCDFKWYKCSNDPKTVQPADWIHVGTSFSYTPKPDDLGYFLKFECTPRTIKGKAKSMAAVADSPVVRGQRKPENLPVFQRHTYTKSKLKGCSFRVVTYNILADVYMKKSEERGELVHCPYYALDAMYRMDLVLKELAGYNADVICLQELDHYAYSNIFQKFFNGRGYSGIFCLKHPRIFEGLACFYRNVKFRLCETTSILYPKEMFNKNPVFQYLWVKVNQSKNYAAAFKRSQNSLLCAVLEFVGDSSKYLVVGNTQLSSNVENSHIRLMQTMMAVEYIQYAVEKYKQDGPNVQIASLLCGDLNSQPDSNVYKFLTTGHLPEDCPDWCSKRGEDFEGIPLLHDLGLKSAYKNLPYTNYTTDFKGCIDYIFYSSNDIQLIQSVPIPSEDVLEAQPALPSLMFPSDHLALVADFRWQQNDTPRGVSRMLHVHISNDAQGSGTSTQGALRARRRRRGGQGRMQGGM